MVKLKIAQIVPYIGDEASGPAYSVPALCSALQKQGCNVTLYTLNPLPQKSFNFKIKGFCRSILPVKSFGRSTEMYKQLLLDSDDIDIIHNHSFWMASNIYAGLVAKKTNIPLMNAPRGTFSEEALSRSKIKKQLVLKFGQQTAINQTNCFHATALHEVEDIKKKYFDTPIAQISNGIDIPIMFKENSLFTKRCKLVFLGRLHSIKGIENLIDVWSLLENRFKKWDLDIVGVGDKTYVDSLRNLIKSKNLQRVKIISPKYGEEKNKIYQQADLYVLPSFSENFGMTVAEALANNTPVITTNKTPWLNLNEKQAGWCIDVGVESLKQVLTLALNKTKEELYAMGVNGRNWMEQDFSWDNIAKDMIATYQWMLKKGTKPNCIKNG
jgi:glycosyltransferase involved in cell wall biosynthesis